MKNSKLFLGLLSIMCLLPLTSCATKHYEAKDYILETEYKDDYKILQLSDTHMANKDDRERQYKFLRRTIETANPDMIIVTGDLFTFATKEVAKEYFSFLDSFNKPWTLTFGNHDEQCYFSIDWMTKQLNEKYEHCLFIDHQDDDVFGNCNFAINLNKDGHVFEQLILLDSNRYNYGEYVGYDYIKDNQIQLYEDVVNYTTQKEGHVVPSHMFFHIPLVEFEEGWNYVKDSEPVGNEAAKTLENCWVDGEIREGFAAPEINTHLFDKILDLGSTKSISVGHDHVNDATYKYKGVYFSFGVTSTDRIYFDEDKLGGKVLTIHNDHTYTFERLIWSYDEYDC